MLNFVNDEIKKKRLNLAKKKLLFYEDNAPSHTPIVVLVKIKEMKFELFPHPPYSPYLAPSDFYLFLNLK